MATTWALRPLGSTRLDVVAEHVAGLGGYEFLGFEDVALGSVLAFEGFELFGGAVAEHVLEELVEGAFVGDHGVSGAALVENGYGGAVGLGLTETCNGL